MRNDPHPRSVEPSTIEESAQQTASVAVDGPRSGSAGAHRYSRSLDTFPIQVYAPATLEEQILSSDVIILASLVSATANVDTVSDRYLSPVFPDPSYAPVHELRFNVHEYLKDSGDCASSSPPSTCPSQALVLVHGSYEDWRDTKVEAQLVADSYLAERNTTWDGQQAILFLNDWMWSYDPAWLTASARNALAKIGYTGDTARKYYFESSTPLENWYYSVDTVSRAWLPGATASSAVTASSGFSAAPPTMQFITDGTELPPPTTTLGELRSEIARIEADLEAHKDVEGYETCLLGKVSYERTHRAMAALGDPWTPSLRMLSLSSGLAAGTDAQRRELDWNSGYDIRWLSHDDADLFRAYNDDDDSDPTTGYDRVLSTTRPLPLGTYAFRYNLQNHRRIPCNFKPTEAYSQYTVTVTAPALTVHEAFFDPVAVCTSVGASATSGALKEGGDARNGVLEPTAFTVGDASAGLASLYWEYKSITLALSPYTPLEHHILDFIALDGTVSLSLDVADATVDETAGTLSWSTATKPWRHGDQLMLRIREAEPSAATSLSTATP